MDKVKTLEILCEEAFVTAVTHGFWEESKNPLTVPTKVALIVTELAELIEAHRAGDDDNLFKELADVWIRLADLTFWLTTVATKRTRATGIQRFVQMVLLQKMAYNKTRPHKHGKRY